ncbi:MAG TPA: tripartite tricarboxylate transporter substrate binding protein [Pseudolabrys sp.]|jgi:tripartite-type tricarboxylate transporter receptor subunit TctC|nr:tripartite tricarboxylate transporter substrate binding protein [Pseudolabrys sp.]
MTRRALPNRRSVLSSIAAAGAFAATGARAQANWPDHPVRIIVPYPAGGSTDVLSRILGERMKEIFGQPFVIENRPGAGGNIGIAAVTGSSPDGYTIGAATIGHFAINQYLYSKMPFDAERDMIPASLTWELPNVFVVATDHCPAKSVSEFISWAKQKGRVSYGSPGVGTSPHLSGVMFVKHAGLDAVHVPFRGAAQTIPAMLAGDVNFAIDNLASYVPAISSGKMRALAVTSAQRWPTMAEVPTMGEAGVKDFIVTSWAAFVVPAGTPRPIVEKIAGAMKKIAAEEDVQKRFLVGGARVLSSTPEGALAYAAKERALWKDVVAASGAKID